MKQIISRAAGMLVLMTILCGFIYTLAVTGIGQLVFHNQANGSVITVDGKTYGSSLLAQPFSGDQYLWGRPMNLDTSSFTDEDGNPTLYAWASNKSPASDEYADIVAQRVDALHEADPTQADVAIPVDLVTCSGSGLDPEISPAAATYQLHRIAEARQLSEEEVQAIIDKHTTGRFLGVFGEPRVNVLEVNLELDGILEG